MPSMYSVPAFLSDHGLSRSFFYRLVKAGQGPRLTKVASRTLISNEDAAEWRERMARQTKQATPAPNPAGGRGQHTRKPAVADPQAAA
jgi:predicted DNA-binding transcriptional regulator AlpA